MKRKHDPVRAGRLSFLCLRCCVLIALAGLFQPAIGADNYWAGGSGDWLDSGNWSLSAVPGASHNTIISNNGTAILSGPGSASVNRLDVGLFNGKSGTLNITGGGALTAVNAYLGSNAGSTGSVTVFGTGSELNVGTYMAVGENGTGRLNIENGGTMTSQDDFYVGANTGSNGTVSISGEGSTLTVIGETTYIGNRGTGRLNIENGGTMTGNGEFYIGTYTGSNGTVTVSGSGSEVNGGNVMYVGCYGTGTLEVTGGGRVATEDRFGIGLWSNSTGTVTVSGAGSAMDVGSMYVGMVGTGTLNVTNGGRVTTGKDFDIGLRSNSTGTVTVSGAGSSVNAGTDIFVGYYGIGTLLEVAGGGRVTTKNRFGIGWMFNSTGTVTVTGTDSTVTVGGSMYVGSSGTGVLEVTDGGRVTTGNDFGIGWNANGTGTVTVFGTGSELNVGTTMYVGYGGTGTATVSDGGLIASGDMSVSGAGTLNVDTDGTVTTDSLRIETGGTANVAGDLVVSGEVYNEGTIKVTTPRGPTLKILDGGKVTNNEVGTISGNDAISSEGSLTVNNRGTITATVYAIYAEKDVNIENSGTIDGGARAITVNGGKIINSGIISSTTSSQSISAAGDLTVENSGTLIGGVLSYGNAAINNSGAITANTSSIAGSLNFGIIVNHDLTLENSGSITGGNRGVLSFGNAAINNSGTISGTTHHGLFIVGEGSVKNSGTIKSDTRSGVVIDHGTIENTGTGAITGGAYGICTLGDAVVKNSGTVTGNTAGIYIGGSAMIDNSGTITGTTGLRFVDGGATLDNWGSITGTGGTAVLMGSGDDRATFHSGSLISGNVDGGSGADSIQFDGTGSITGGTALNFETITKSGDGTWTIGGNLSSGRELHLEQGVLRVEGQYTQEKDSELYVTFTKGESGLISAGTAQLKGGLVVANGYVRKGRHTLIETDNGLTGAFDGAVAGEENDLGLFQKYVLGYDDKNAFIDISRSSLFVDYALTRNQRAVGGYLDRIYGLSPTGDMATVRNEIMKITDAALYRSALDQMGGASHTIFWAIDQARQVQFFRALFRREAQPPPAVSSLRAAESRNPFVQLALNAEVRSAADAAPLLPERMNKREDGVSPWDLWVKGYGLFGGRRGDDIASRYDYSIGGLLAGADRRLDSQGSRAGFAFGYARISSDMKDLENNNGSEDSFQGALYGTLEREKWYLDGALSFSYNRYDTKRPIVFGGINRTAEGSYSGYDVSGYAEGGRRIEAPSFQVTPFVSFLALRSHRNGFTETGADSLNLVTESSSSISLQSALGAKVSRRFTIGKEFSLTPEASARWLHVFGDVDARLEARFSGAPAGSGSFTVYSDEGSRDSAVVGLGLQASIGHAWSLYAYYDGQFQSDQLSHAFTGGVQYRW